MIWILALGCLAVVGLAGYYQGPVRAVFSLGGIIFGMLLASPLAPLTRHLLPLLGLHHPAWEVLAPNLLAFLIVLLLFKIAGAIVHNRVAHYYKYQRDEVLYFRWQRLYSRLGLCVGVFNGALYFFLLMLPIYIAGYFTTELQAQRAPPGAQFLTSAREDLHQAKLDRVLAKHDPTPDAVYEASDIVALVLHNPLLESRLSHYPPLLTLGEQKEFQDLATDVDLQQMIQSQAKVSDILARPEIRAIVTNGDTVTLVINTLAGEPPHTNLLQDLYQYLLTGKSAQFDSEPMYGIWGVDLNASVAEERKRNKELTPLQLRLLKLELAPEISGLTLKATTDDQMILKRDTPNTVLPVIVARGTWKKGDDDYEVTIPGNKPDKVAVLIENSNRLLLPRGGHTLVFNKEIVY